MHDGRPACAVREIPYGGGRPRLALRARGPSNETEESRSEETEDDRAEEEARRRTGQNERKESDSKKRRSRRTGQESERNNRNAEKRGREKEDARVARPRGEGSIARGSETTHKHRGACQARENLSEERL